jgi:hypothetical protein
MQKQLNFVDSQLIRRGKQQGLTVRPELVEGWGVKPFMVRQAHHERLNLNSPMLSWKPLCPLTLCHEILNKRSFPCHKRALLFVLKAKDKE